MRRRLATLMTMLATVSVLQVVTGPPAGAAVYIQALNEKVWTNSSEGARLRARIAIETNSTLTQGRYRLHLTCYGINPFDGRWETTSCTFNMEGAVFFLWHDFFLNEDGYDASLPDRNSADGDETWTGAWHSIDRSGDILEYWTEMQVFRAYFEDAEYWGAYHTICSKYWDPRANRDLGARC